MSTIYHYANLTRKESFRIDAFGGTSKLRGLGGHLAARAFALLLKHDGPIERGQRRLTPGRWSGDSIAVIGDLYDDAFDFPRSFVSLEADVIRLLIECDGFDVVGEAARTEPRLFLELCHLVATRQLLEIEPDLERTFGSNYRSLSLATAREHSWWEPHDLHNDLAPG